MENRVPVYYLDDEHTQIIVPSRLFWQPVMLSGMPMVIVFLLKLMGKGLLRWACRNIIHTEIVDNKTAYYDKGVGKTTAVGSYPANDYGLHDMAGNVWEICWDWYLKDWYSQPGAVAKSSWPDVDSLKASFELFGGSMPVMPIDLRCIIVDFNPTWSQYLIGFRTVISEPPSTPAIDITALSTLYIWVLFQVVAYSRTAGGLLGGQAYFRR